MPLFEYFVRHRAFRPGNDVKNEGVGKNGDANQDPNEELKGINESKPFGKQGRIGSRKDQIILIKRNRSIKNLIIDSNE